MNRFRTRNRGVMATASEGGGGYDPYPSEPATNYWLSYGCANSNYPISKGPNTTLITGQDFDGITTGVNIPNNSTTEWWQSNLAVAPPTGSVVLQVVIECGDGLAPEFGSATASSGLNQFVFKMRNVSLDPTLITVTQVSATQFHCWQAYALAGSNPGVFGLLRSGTNISDTLKLSRMAISVGTTP